MKSSQFQLMVLYQNYGCRKKFIFNDSENVNHNSKEEVDKNIDFLLEKAEGVYKIIALHFIYVLIKNHNIYSIRKNIIIFSR